MANSIKRGLCNFTHRFFAGLLCLVFSPLTSAFAQTDNVAGPNVRATAAIQIEATPTAVWTVLAEDFAGIGEWSSGVAHSQGFGEPIGGSPYSVRACEITAVGFDDTKERVTRFDEEALVLSYTLFDGLPGFVKDAENTWTLTARDGGTWLEGTTEMRATGPLGFMMRGMMKGATRKALESMATELKYYVERGTPHPDKLASVARENRKHAKKRKKVTSFTVEQDIDAPADKAWDVVAGEFGAVHLSHPVSDKSHYLAGYDRPVEGAVRIMYMTEDEKKFFVDKLVEVNETDHRMTVEVIEAEGYPIVAGHTWVNFNVLSTAPNSSRLSVTFNYLTKPAFLKGVAKGSLKRQFANYALSIAHRVETFIVRLYPEVLHHVFEREMPAPSRVAPADEEVPVEPGRKIPAGELLGGFTESLRFYFTNPQLVTEELILLKIRELLLLLLQVDDSGATHRLLHALFDPQVYEPRLVVDRHLYDSLGLEQLARLCNLSLSSFKRKFKQLSGGESPGAYITHRRMEKAKELLATTASVGEIALDCGYQDQGHFTKVFQRTYGLTPSTYRKGLTTTRRAKSPTRSTYTPAGNASSRT